MSKAILVIDMPENCLKCPLRYDYKASEICILEDDIVDYFYETNTKPDWCPLRPLPENKIVKQYQGNGVYGFKTSEDAHLAMGWNRCLTEILGMQGYIDYFIKQK